MNIFAHCIQNIDDETSKSQGVIIIMKHKTKISIVLALVVIAIALTSCSRAPRNQGNAGLPSQTAPNSRSGIGSYGSNSTYNNNNYAARNESNNTDWEADSDHSWFTDMNAWALGPIQPYGYATETIGEALARIYNSVDNTTINNNGNYYRSNPLQDLDPFYKPIRNTTPR